ncbi:hypothetical protein [Streptosporangium vulgare]|uniref:Bacterial Ig domain-containing protein n=1 Tax=Streptosporangium vulgare TaxID=46190 RepID=A0ABV5TC07_9ACTN
MRLTGDAYVSHELPAPVESGATATLVLTDGAGKELPRASVTDE